MKNLFRNAAIALSILSLGAAVSPVSVSLNKTKMVSMVPTCAPSDPNGCGILSK